MTSNHDQAQSRVIAAVKLARQCHHHFVRTRMQAFSFMRDQSMKEARHWQSIRKGRKA